MLDFAWCRRWARAMTLAKMSSPPCSLSRCQEAYSNELSVPGDLPPLLPDVYSACVLLYPLVGVVRSASAVVS